jgi:acetyl-CoA carboxylase, biotin carboxylase subunit
MSKKKIKKILIANRGEIALRVIRACREMEIATVAVYSKGDEESLHVKWADEAVCIGPVAPKQSYLNIANILTAADITGADAIHPGYGFLSENSEFAKLCAQCGIQFIGPTPENIEAIGNKTQARKIAKRAGVPLLPGTMGAVENVQSALEAAKEIGYPLLLKSASGGGGRGIYLVEHPHQLETSFARLTQEVKAAFGDGAMFLEKYCENPRHVEIQVACDRYGNRVYLGERDCTIQRRHQKLIEESPSPVIDDLLRKKMGQSALLLCEEIGYENVGTAEFLVDRSGRFYFIEMNTRIQVEHTVTEMVTGIDLVKEQIHIASGEELSFEQRDIRIKGHAIECRINAEDPEKFTPSPGKVKALHFPGGFNVRVESHIYDGYEVGPYYDSLIAKIIVSASSRNQAILKMQQALDEFQIEGIASNAAFHRKIMRDLKFKEGSYDTNFLQEFLARKVEADQARARKVENQKV